ncbi:MAG: hypothetical protein ACM3X1_02020 [Ignavibacteriales bacterium]
MFKYEGDAVIILFPAMYDEALACRNALNCSMAILEIVTQVINPAFKKSDLPEITVKIGLAYGKTLVVVYGRSIVRSHVDIVKQIYQSETRPNKVEVSFSFRC